MLKTSFLLCYFSDYHKSYLLKSRGNDCFIDSLFTFADSMPSMVLCLCDTAYDIVYMIGWCV